MFLILVTFDKMKSIILTCLAFLLVVPSICQKKAFIDSLFYQYRVGNDKVIGKRMKTFKASKCFKKNYSTYYIWKLSVKEPISFEEIRNGSWYHKLVPFLRNPYSKKIKSIEHNLYFIDPDSGAVIANYEGPWRNLYCNPLDGGTHIIWQQDKEILDVLKREKFDYVFEFASLIGWKYLGLKNEQFSVITVKKDTIEVDKLNDFIFEKKGVFNDMFPKRLSVETN